MKDYKHVSIDIETAALPASDDYKALVLSIGIVPFDAENGVLEDKGLEMRLEVLPQILKGFRIDSETVAWWNKQSPAAIELAWGSQRKHPGEVLENLNSMIGGDTKIWAKGVRFDLNIVEALYSAFGMDKPWHWRNERCMRVLGEMVDKTRFKQENDLKHGALADAICQAHEIVAAKRATGFWKTPKYIPNEKDIAEKEFLDALREVGGEAAVVAYHEDSLEPFSLNVWSHNPEASTYLFNTVIFNTDTRPKGYWTDLYGSLRAKGK